MSEVREVREDMNNVAKLSSWLYSTELLNMVAGCVYRLGAARPSQAAANAPTKHHIS